MFGCVEERAITLTGSEIPITTQDIDIDANGIPEARIIEFKPIVIDSELNINLRRIITVHEVGGSLQTFNYTNITAQDVQILRSYLSDFKNPKEKFDKQCLQSLGFEGNMIKCLDADSCVEACTSQKCRDAAEYGKQTFGSSLFLYKTDSDKIDELILELDSKLDELEGASEIKLSEFVKTADQILLKIYSIKTNSLFNSRLYGVCSSPNYKMENIYNMLDMVVEEINYTNQQYKCSSYFLLTGGDETEYTEIYIRENPSRNLEIDQFSIVIEGNGELVEENPPSVEWRGIRVGVFEKTILKYSFLSSTPFDEEVFSKWKLPGVSERTIQLFGYFVSLKDNIVVMFAMNLSKFLFDLFYIFLGYYPSLALVLSFWVVAFFLTIYLLQYTYIGATTFIADKNVMHSLLEYFLPPLADKDKYLVTGGILLLIGIPLGLFFSKTILITELVLSDIPKYLGTDIAGSLSTVFIVLGIYTIYIVVEDHLKAIMLGQGYYSASEATTQSNRANYKKTKELLSQLKKEVERATAQKLDVKSEYDVVNSIPLHRINHLIEVAEKQDVAFELIKFNYERIAEALKSINEKENIVESKWELWEKNISGLMGQNDSILIASIVSIPPQWRRWAVTRFVGEHAGEGYLIENDELKRKQVSAEHMAEKLMGSFRKKGIIKSGIIIKNGKPAYIFTERGSKSVVTVLSLKLISLTSAFEKSFRESILRSVAVGKNTILLFSRANTTFSVLIVEKSKAKEVMETWSKSLGLI